jgi:hypothetical protein
MVFFRTPLHFCRAAVGGAGRTSFIYPAARTLPTSAALASSRLLAGPARRAFLLCAGRRARLYQETPFRHEALDAEAQTRAGRVKDCMRVACLIAEGDPFTHELVWAKG